MLKGPSFKCEHATEGNIHVVPLGRTFRAGAQLATADVAPCAIIRC